MKIDGNILYAPCPCGSGKKFKFCCMQTVRDYLPDNPTQAEVTTEVRKAMQPYGMVNDIDPVEDREAIDLMRRGVMERDKRNLDEALRLFRKSREMKPKLYTSWNNEATCLWECGRFEDAVKAQKDGLALSSDCNSFGWAQLAEFQYFLGRDEESAESLVRAMAIPPITDDCATKVCAALALQKRHADIVEYARKSGFDKSAWVAFYSGIAAMNTGDRESARRLLEIADDGGAGGTLADDVQWDITDVEKESECPFGEWQYFTVESYEAGALAGRAMAERRPEHENVVCDLLELMLAERCIAKKDALEAIESFGGRRSKRLREWLATTGAFDEVSSEFDPYESSGDEIAAQKMLADLGFEAVTLDESVEPCEKLEGEDDKIFRDAIENYKHARAGSKKWIKARDAFKDIYERHPEFFRAGFNYATMLQEEGGISCVVKVAEKIASEHPEYAYAQAALVRAAIDAGDFAKAEKLVRGYHPPVRMHPLEYRAWLRAQLAFYVAVRDDVRADNIEDAIDRIEREFGLQA